MQLSSLIGHAGQCSSIILKSAKPADALVSEYTREHKYLGSSDRRILSELVFSYLRNKTVIEVIASEVIEQKDLLQLQALSPIALYKFFLLITFIVVFDKHNQVQVSIDSFFRFFELNEDTAIELKNFIEKKYSELSTISTLESLSTFYSIPIWILDLWAESTLKNRTFQDQTELSNSLCNPAPLCIRVNTQITTAEETLQRLLFAGIEARFSDFIPNCIIINQRVSLLDTNLYKSGAIEIQDESSQIAAFAVAPEEHWSILDACAGAGGKSLHLSTLQKDLGSIVATDIEWNRLKQIQKRNERHRFSSISTFLWGQKNKKFPHSSFDAVFVDAPCSGLGTIRRMPLPKWKLSKESITKLAKNQLDILNNYSKYVAKGGVLVYATCSFLPQENENVVEEFLSTNPEFEKDSLKPGFEKFGVPLQPDVDYCTTMLPSVHGSDGFFVARLRKNG